MSIRESISWSYPCSSQSIYIWKKTLLPLRNFFKFDKAQILAQVELVYMFIYTYVCTEHTLFLIIRENIWMGTGSIGIARNEKIGTVFTQTKNDFLNCTWKKFCLVRLIFKTRNIRNTYINFYALKIFKVWRPGYTPGGRSNQLGVLYSTTLGLVPSLYISCFVFSNKLVLSYLSLRLLLQKLF